MLVTEQELRATLAHRILYDATLSAKWRSVFLQWYDQLHPLTYRQAQIILDK